MLYAGESMRVTTRLMQAASWLLVQRAVRDGDMARDDAMSDRYRLGSREFCLSECADDVSPLPSALLDLLVRSERGRDDGPVTLGWITIGRDTSLEQQILFELKGRLSNIGPGKKK